MALLVTGAVGVAAAGAGAAQPVIDPAAATTTSGSFAEAPEVVPGPARAPDRAHGTVHEAAAFTDCMRSHGVPGFPGVTISDDKRVYLDFTGTDVDPTSAHYRDAATACAPLLPEGVSLPQPPLSLPNPGCEQDFLPRPIPPPDPSVQPR